MIHELIEPKKKTVRNSSAKNLKTPNDSKTLRNDVSFDQIDIEDKEEGSSSTTFILPWLRNNLGLNHKNKQSYTISDSKAVRQPKVKESDPNETNSLNFNTEEVCCPKVTEELKSSTENRNEDVETSSRFGENVSVLDSNHEKEMSVFWSNPRKQSETDSIFTIPECKNLKNDDSKVTNLDIPTSFEFSKLKDDDRKKLKCVKQKYRLKKRLVSDCRGGEPARNEVNYLLEMRAREVLDNYTKKNVHSVSSDLKQLEAKLILLSCKGRDVDRSKLSQQEARLLQEIKKQAGSKEVFEKLIDQIKESNLKEILKTSECLTKTLNEKIKCFGDKEDFKKVPPFCLRTENKGSADGESTMSTDDENDIKRFSEFLSKNKNIDEKRKCLEEVRNYFEKKRRLRMSKKKLLERPKNIAQSFHTLLDNGENGSREKTKSKNEISVMSGKDKRTKYGVCDEVVVEKAVDETLQKFVDLYHFRVSPSAMGSMKRNILQAIQSDPHDIAFPKSKEVEKSEKKESQENEKPEKECLVKDELVNNNMDCNAKGRSIFVNENDNVFCKNKGSHLNSGADSRKKNFRNLIENSKGAIIQNTTKENETEEDNVSRLKKEFENFLLSIQTHSDINGLKLQSVILEKEGQTCISKNLQVYNSLYNFTKKGLEPIKTVGNNPHLSLEKISRVNKETQTHAKTEMFKKSVKTQISFHVFTCERSLQTETNFYSTRDSQTGPEENEDLFVKKLTQLKGFDISPGLYRMVKAKQVGKFYLYPEIQERNLRSESPKSDSFAVKENQFKSIKDGVSVESIGVVKKIKPSQQSRNVSTEKDEKKHLNKKSLSEKSSIENIFDVDKSKSSINCLFLRDNSLANTTICNSQNTQVSEEKANIIPEEYVKEEVAEENNVGFTWYWNGEKINPGFDLKAHVEELLKEKLEEITKERTRDSFSKNSEKDSFTLKDETTSSNDYQDSDKHNYKDRLKDRKPNSITCFAKDAGPKGDSTPFFYTSDSESFESKSNTQENSNTDNRIEITKSPATKKVSVKDVAIQSSKFFTCPEKSKFVPRTNIAGRTLRSRHRRRRLTVKPFGKDSRLSYKEATNIIRAMRELKHFNIEKSLSTMSSDPYSLSTMGYTTSSSLKSLVDEPLTVIMGVPSRKNSGKSLSIDFKSKLRKIISLVDDECQTSNIRKDQDDISLEDHKMEHSMGKYRQWELIESVLNRINQKQKENFWFDIKDYVKNKLGKDIKDEGMKEVCIEIEREMPVTGNGKGTQPVLAKGHYVKQEGDVEIEIDLTLDDLERILRRRQKKIRRRQVRHSSRTKKRILCS